MLDIVLLMGQVAAGEAAPVVAEPPRPITFVARTEDYPRAARAAGAQGNTAVQFQIDDDGRVSACSVTSSSGNADLDAATCAILRKARFRPARDAAGKRVPFTDSFQMAWRLHPDPCPPRLLCISYP